jgi:hypothetical protein
MTTSLLLSQRQLLCDTPEKLNSAEHGNDPARPALFVLVSNTTEHSAPVSENVADTIFGIRGFTVEEIDSTTFIIAEVVLLPYSIADMPRIRTFRVYKPGVNPYADNEYSRFSSAEDTLM